MLELLASYKEAITILADWVGVAALLLLMLIKFVTLFWNFVFRKY